MSPPYDNRGSSRSRRGVWSHWVPLIVTVTVATVGVAAWVWSQRKDEQEEHVEHEADLDYDHGDYGDNPAYGASRENRQIPPPAQLPQQGEPSYGLTPDMAEGSGAGWGSRVSSALKRTPSPQQFFDSTGKTVAAGVAAAGAAVGKALASIREEDRSYTEENPWSEETEVKKDRSTPAVSDKRRRTVAIVVSADAHVADVGEDGLHEHASILSHIPRHNDLSAVKLFVLIYAPGLKETPNETTTTSNRPPPSISSSFSNIGHDQAQTPGEEKNSPILGASAENTLFNAIYSQAQGLVSKETMILPFTTPNGHTHILRHLQPEIIYLQESLAGDNGGVITNLHTWLRHDVVLVVGAESGHGGLADSESEAERVEKSSKSIKWWQRPERVGRGRGIVVVDSIRVHDDWTRRVQGQE
ncbi:hypothetical protein PT974_00143 [Cladobotryum mycophilum]|uniref:Peroxin 22-like protein n=1 Tax=Cladobotryum mycophilum TaxID=491253 RepID=A0ABR0T046_9HYPO